MILCDFTANNALKKTFKETSVKDDNTSIEDLLMEKICIVRRRIQNPVLPEQLSFCVDSDKKRASDVADLHSSFSDGNGKQHASPFRNAIRDNDHVIRIQLTPDQCKVVQSNGCLDRFLGQILGDVDLELERYEDGQIVFNFHLKHVYRTDMLDSKKVCQMLQVSRSFLAKLIKDERIRSYKFGRLRRFLLEDIIEYLSHSEVLQNIKGQTLDTASGTFIKEKLGEQPVS